MSALRAIRAADAAPAPPPAFEALFRKEHARVVAIAPFVIDTLDLEKSMEHHYRAYGFWAPAVKDYVDMPTERVSLPLQLPLEPDVTSCSDAVWAYGYEP